MRPFTCIIVLLVLSAGVGVESASAQGAAAPAARRAPARTQRVRISVNALWQPSSIAFTGSTAKVVLLENAVTETAYEVGSGLAFDGGVLFRIAGGFHVGAAVSSFTKKHDAAVTATIPHPFFFNTPRPVTGTASNLERNELVTHLQAAYVIRPGNKLDIALSAGPSWFMVKQDMVTGVTYTESYPFDTATFVAASSTAVSESKLGYNAGVDVGVRLSKNVGIGGLVRFSRASIEFPVPGAATNAKSDAGGIQAGGGIRLFF